MEIKAYDYDTADSIFDALFCHGKDREDGLREIPAASIQMVVSALELLSWDVYAGNWETLKAATAIVENLRDQQKRREFIRENSTRRV